MGGAPRRRSARQAVSGQIRRGARPGSSAAVGGTTALDIRRAKSVRFMAPSTLELIEKSVMQVEFDEEDEKGFVRVKEVLKGNGESLAPRLRSGLACRWPRRGEAEQAAAQEGGDQGSSDGGGTVTHGTSAMSLIPSIASDMGLSC